MGDCDGVGVRRGVEFEECGFECEEGVVALWARCVVLVLIFGLVESGVVFEGPGDGEGEGNGFSVGNVNVGKISDVEAAADSGGTTNGWSAVVGKVVLYGGTYEMEDGIGEGALDPLDLERNRGGLRYVVLEPPFELEPNTWPCGS